jgi:hypothetical protein
MKLAFYGFLTVLCFARFECEQRDCGCVSPHGHCAGTSCVPVVIKDLSNLDGCGIGLELFDGKVLIPERRVYVQAPDLDEDPAYYFPFVPGDTICVAYQHVELATVCMAGENVFLTCITAGRISDVSGN